MGFTVNDNVNEKCSQRGFKIAFSWRQSFLVSTA